MRTERPFFYSYMRCDEPHRVDPAQKLRAEPKTSSDAERNVAPSAQVGSGNSRGQLKGVRNFAADFKRSLEIPVTLNDKGSRPAGSSGRKAA